MVLEIIPVYVWFALVGALIREFWGVWRYSETFVDVRLAAKRIAISFSFAWFFGIIGGLILEQFNIFPLGVNLAALFSGVLSGNSISFLLKKLGWSQKLEVPVSEDQLQPNMTPREINAIKTAKKLGKVTTQYHQRINSVTRRAAQNDLQKLVQKRFLIQHGRGRGSYYTASRSAR